MQLGYNVPLMILQNMQLAKVLFLSVSSSWARRVRWTLQMMPFLRADECSIGSSEYEVVNTRDLFTAGNTQCSELESAH